MKLDCARYRPSYKANKQKRRWYKKVHWTYYKGNAQGSIKFGSMSVNLQSDGWSWVASTNHDYRRHTKTGVEKTRQLAQKRALDACRKLVGLGY